MPRIRKGKADEALVEIQKILEENPNDLTAKVFLSRSYSLLGRLEDSEAILLSVIRENSSFSNASLTLGIVYIQKKKYNDAESLLNRALELDNGNHIAYANLAKIALLRDGDAAKSRSILLHAIDLNENDERLWFEMGMVSFYIDDHSAGRAAFERAEAINPDIDHKLIARIYLHYKHVDWAVVSLEKHLRAVTLDGSTLVNANDSQAKLLLAECR